SALAVARGEASSVEERSEAAAQSAFRADNEVSGLDAEIARLRDLSAHLDQRLETAASEAHAIAIRLSELGSGRRGFETRLRSLEGDAQARTADVEAEEAALANLRTEEANADQIAEKLRQEVADATTSAAAIRARLDALRERIPETRARRDRI